MSGHLLAVVSGKGGVGKSFLTAALGARLAAMGERVVLVDLSTGLRHLDILFGLESRVGFDLHDVVEGVCGLDRALITDRQSGARLLLARQTQTDAPCNERTLRILLEVLCLQNDYVLLDAPCGLGDGFSLAARMADASLLVATPDNACCRAAERAAAEILRHGRPHPYLVINRLQAALVEAGLQHTPAVCAQLLDLRLLAAIPEDDLAQRAMLQASPLLQDTQAAAAIDTLAERLEALDRPQWEPR